MAHVGAGDLDGMPHPSFRWQSAGVQRWSYLDSALNVAEFKRHTGLMDCDGGWSERGPDVVGVFALPPGCFAGLGEMCCRALAIVGPRG